ncbi:hypothetical protein BLA9940_01197 [Burkholderia aenigmatica]|uniref:hypothetical protein n=1 Tax=Burkholderia cepacia complex TaxID=87882 RepID=UPI000F091ACA|nr:MULTISPECIES: hypothetical protein [Burkholderia cepacia complex]AYQ38545.1 hypothetical protein CVS37_10810 [Burkholderia lata]VWC47570.1 hypothetical protein BLA9940_01197 [Burkholderia aenigmatica]
MGILDRLGEPSTHAGIGVLATAASTAAIQLGANPTKVGAIAAILQALFGLFAVFVPDTPATPSAGTPGQ